MDTSAAGWEAAGLALGNASRGLREEKPQSLNPKWDSLPAAVELERISSKKCCSDNKYLVLHRGG